MTAETGVKWLLRMISITTIPAFIAAIMPQSNLSALLNWMQPGSSVGLLESYIVRCLMCVYALLGVQAVIWSTNVKRYRPLIISLCVFCIPVAMVGLVALFATVSLTARTKTFWIIFVDLAEGLALLVLLLILTLRVPRFSVVCVPPEKKHNPTD
jgi:hypothetical protein